MVFQMVNGKSGLQTQGLAPLSPYNEQPVATFSSFMWCSYANWDPSAAQTLSSSEFSFRNTWKSCVLVVDIRVELSEIKGISQKRSSGNKSNSVASTSCKIYRAPCRIKIWGPCSNRKSKVLLKYRLSNNFLPFFLSLSWPVIEDFVCIEYAPSSCGDIPRVSSYSQVPGGLALQSFWAHWLLGSHLQPLNHKLWTSVVRKSICLSHRPITQPAVNGGVNEWMHGWTVAWVTLKDWEH